MYFSWIIVCLTNIMREAYYYTLRKAPTSSLVTFLRV